MKTDDELNALFAEHVAGLYPDRNWNEIRAIEGHLATPSGPFMWPSYTTDANAVLPWLEKHSAEIHHVHRENIGWRWEVDAYVGGSYFPTQGDADTFPRAAVIALLRAKGVAL